MKRVLVLYPELFKSYSKFCRKLSKILSNFYEYTLVSNLDPNSFISSYCKKNLCDYELSNIDMSELNVSHVIVFDDGEEFSEEVKLIKDKNIPIRVIDILITRVINIKKDVQYKGLKSTKSYEYIGRGSYWGNPYSMFEDGDDREEVIRKYKYDFDYNKFPKKEKSEVYKLAGKRLGCFCKPQCCHGDVLANFLNQWDDKK